MLKRLELVGFKSFADRTTFDFDAGLTGVIGPNGSGKSNVVDAIKWALGEQSAKSLRGGEMIDVIFNGSATRKTLGMAEVALVFDNAKRQLAAEADEVRIARRVYRSGEAEYLLNNEVCRLKDVKDVLLGSGAGSDAYSIIEQGRVDQLLQTGAKERRAIFEEAAGISRFRARKAEALRRLERVAGNMTRLRDILDEVEKQRRTAEHQAGKARSYQQHTARLRELSVALALREYHALAGRLAEEGAALEALREALRGEAALTEGNQRELDEIDARLDQVAPHLAEVDATLSRARERIAEEKVRRDGNWAALERAEAALPALRGRIAALTLEMRGIEREGEAAGAEVADARRRRDEAAAAADLLAGEKAALDSRREALRDEIEALKAGHFDLTDKALRLSNAAVGHATNLDNRERELARRRESSNQTSKSLAALDVELAGLSADEQALRRELADAGARRDTLRAEREALEGTRDDLGRRAADLRETRSGLRSQADVLEELEASHEGLGTGVREVLGHLMEDEDGPWRTVVGLVAEVLTVRREYAPLIDLALGERAQRFLIRDRAELAEALRRRGAPLSGRVSFLSLTPSVPPLYGEEALADPGVVALAEDVVHCDADFAGLPRLLLGQTAIVRDLAAAEALAARLPGWRLITLAGEAVEPDGTVTLGTHHGEAGILSRRSALADLHENIARLDADADDLKRRLEATQGRLTEMAGRIGHAEGEVKALEEKAGRLRAEIAQRLQKREILSSDVDLSQSEMGGLEREVAELRILWEQARREHAEAEAAALAAKARMEDAERESRALEAGQGEQMQKAADARVALARADARHKELRSRLGDLDKARGERQAEAERAERELAELAAERDEAVTALLRGSALLASAHHDKQESERILNEGRAVRAELVARKKALEEQGKAGRVSLKQRHEAARERERAVDQLQMTRGGLCDKMRDGFQVELEELHRGRVAAGEAEFAIPPAEGDNAGLAPEAEIADLRTRLKRIGGVNMDALAELEELQARHAGLKVQFDDLDEARASLESTIGRINTDCRRLFTEAYDAIRGQFQELFRKLFAGGMADVVLEEGVDILEAGIEIIAKPPGKELRGISQMSGGEKTMTAVALLLAIFRSKPSPFCILDEVDAALDEANVARLANVLVEFAAETQFIVITHRHRTMAAIPSLIGVTMAESGVSSRCSVRLEDWVEEGRQAA